jgi:amidophosphoribosyltransferase
MLLKACADRRRKDSLNKAFAGRPREECGVFAIYNYRGPDTAAHLAYLGLLALQHRGQESAGMAFNGPGGLKCRKGMGLVSQLFSREMLAEIDAPGVLGHVRYSTTGTSSINNAQPMVARSVRGGGIALAHNGNLSNNAQLRQAMLAQGHIFHATSDTETILSYLFLHRRLGLIRAVQKAMAVAEGAYAAVAMDSEAVIAFRDPYGFRPLVMGRIKEAVVFASETCALDTVGADFIREVEPGEIILVEKDKISATAYSNRPPESFCIFEFVYFARPDSNFKGRNVHLVRKAIGKRLARHAAPGLELIIPSPDSGLSAAMGMAEAAGLPLEWAIYRNPYLGRTFIEPAPGDRDLAARLKYSPVYSLLKGKKVGVVDDSLVRGTTARKLTTLLKGAGAEAVHFYIAAPPYRYPCYYGVDIPVAADLAAVKTDPERLAGAVGADSITFASLEDLFAATGDNSTGFCSACFSGIYPISPD